jgi:hypothetical protein
VEEEDVIPQLRNVTPFHKQPQLQQAQQQVQTVTFHISETQAVVNSAVLQIKWPRFGKLLTALKKPGVLILVVVQVQLPNVHWGKKDVTEAVPRFVDLTVNGVFRLIVRMDVVLKQVNVRPHLQEHPLRQRQQR